MEDSRESCVKCGHKDISGPKHTRRDKLEFWCRRCQYEWTTPCLDAGQEKPKRWITIPFLNYFRKKDR